MDDKVTRMLSRRHVYNDTFYIHYRRVRRSCQITDLRMSCENKMREIEDYVILFTIYNAVFFCQIFVAIRNEKL